MVNCIQLHADTTKKDLWNDIFGERFKRIEALWVLLAIMVSPAGIPPIRPTVIICRWAGLLRAHQSPFVSSFLCDSSHHTLTYSHACATDNPTSDQEKEHPLPMLIFPHEIFSLDITRCFRVFFSNSFSWLCCASEIWKMFIFISCLCSRHFVLTEIEILQCLAYSNCLNWLPS